MKLVYVYGEQASIFASQLSTELTASRIANNIYDDSRVDQGPNDIVVRSLQLDARQHVSVVIVYQEARIGNGYRNYSHTRLIQLCGGHTNLSQDCYIASNSSTLLFNLNGNGFTRTWAY